MVVAYYALHYGKEWLKWSMRSIVNFVDEIVVVYTPQPSYGHGTDMVCPDTLMELKEIADVYDAHWSILRGSRWEGDHRDEAVHICEDMGADIVMAVDHDEIWDTDMLLNCLDLVKSRPERNYKVPMQHYWRSVGWVCHDEARPDRFIKTDPKDPEGVHLVGKQWGNVHHFGYAQTMMTMVYKWQIHGHLPELRRGWLENKFQAWEPGMKDVHPTNLGYWDPVEFDRVQIANLIGDHPYFNLEIIP